MDTSAPYAVTWDSSTMPGERLLSALAYDHGHNVGLSAPVPVTVTLVTTSTVLLPLVLVQQSPGR
jgi:hypothetical protein